MTLPAGFPLNRVFADRAGQGSEPLVSVLFTPPSPEGILGVRFEVCGSSQCVNAALPADRSQWGLWDWDVVEVFLSANDSSVYYEFQLSPLDQFFELEIFEPRKRINKDFHSGFSHSVQQLPDGAWIAELKIPLGKLAWTGKLESLRGNAFAILGAPGARSYLSLNLPRQTKPDFHLPQFFKPLF